MAADSFEEPQKYVSEGNSNPDETLDKASGASPLSPPGLNSRDMFTVVSPVGLDPDDEYSCHVGLLPVLGMDTGMTTLVGSFASTEGLGAGFGAGWALTTRTVGCD